MINNMFLIMPTNLKGMYVHRVKQLNNQKFAQA